MAGLISPRPLSYLQHPSQLNPYQKALSAYSGTPPISASSAGPGGATGGVTSSAPTSAGGLLSALPSLARVGTPGSLGGQFGLGLNNGSAQDALGHEDDKIYALVIELMDPATREAALLELSKKREQYDDLALVLWHSFGEPVLFARGFPPTMADWTPWGMPVGIMPVLLQEIVSVYPLLSPPNLTAHVSNRVCNALALLQCVASHSETRSLFLSGNSSLFRLSKSRGPG